MSPADNTPTLVMLVGANGSGKSTFYHLYLRPKGLAFLNADLIAKELWPNDPELHSYEAMRLVEKSREEALRHGRSFCFETVFSHPSKVDFIHQAKQLGYIIHLYYFHLTQPDLNVLRVSQRTTEGGHSVPEEKIRSRIPRTLANLKAVIPCVDKLVLLDNSRYDDPYRVQAVLNRGSISQRSTHIETWAKDILENLP